MAKIGSKLQETRLRKGLTLDRIADDTNISVRFLSKIENDDFTGFPGEPYVVGFIRNYSEYLGMNPEGVVALYRNESEELPVQAPPPAPATQDPGRAKPSLRTEAVTSSAAHGPAENPEMPAGGTIAETQDLGTGNAPDGTALSPSKPRKPRKPRTTAEKTPEARPEAKNSPAGDKPAIDGKENKQIPRTAPPSPPTGKKLSLSALRAGLLSVAAIAIVVSALLWIVAGGRSAVGKPRAKGKGPAEYRVEGGPFEMRLYVGDSLLVPLGNEVYKIRLESISDAVGLETPFGPFKLSLGETGPIDPDKNGSPDASLIIGDFEKNRPASGALIRLEFAPPETGGTQQAEVTIPETPGPDKTVSADTVILRSTRGPYPFVVQVSFRGNCLFRYEADRKEWVEKYYSKGESVTINASNALTVWASNAQAAKLTFQASGGKTADLEIGAPGEISVKRIAWSRAESSWALISSDLD